MCNPAVRIIQAFDGIRPLSRALGLENPTTVQGWKKRGIIPPQQQPKVLQVAQDLGVEITMEDFFVQPGDVFPTPPDIRALRRTAA